MLSDAQLGEIDGGRARGQAQTGQRSGQGSPCRRARPTHRLAQTQPAGEGRPQGTSVEAKRQWQERPPSAIHPAATWLPTP
jgi:hypothetical protein